MWILQLLVLLLVSNDTQSSMDLAMDYSSRSQKDLTYSEPRNLRGWSDKRDDEHETNALKFIDLLKSDRQTRMHKKQLTSQQQGILLVEALRKKRNFTSAGDIRGHGSDLQSGIMDMLGKST